MWTLTVYIFPVTISGEDYLRGGGISQALDPSLFGEITRGCESSSWPVTFRWDSEGVRVKLLTCHFRGDLGRLGEPHFTMLSYIELDGTRIEVVKGVPKIKRTEHAYRIPVLLKNDFREEIVLNEIRRRNFLYPICPFFTWIKRIIPEKKLKMTLFTGLARFFSIKLNLVIQREHYRRKITAVYWLNQHFDQIQQYIQQHRIKIGYDENEYQLTYP